MNLQYNDPEIRESDPADAEKPCPFSANTSLFSEIDKENPNLFKGGLPLRNEPPAAYYERIYYERRTLDRLADKKLSGSSGFVSALLILLIALIYGTVFLVNFNLYLLNDSAYSLLNWIFSLVQYLVFFPILFIVAKINLKTKIPEFFTKPKVGAGYIVRWTIISMAAVYVVSFLFSIFFAIVEAMGFYVNNSSGITPQSIPEYIIYMLVVVICAPLFEEILFRGYIMTSLTKYGQWFAVITSGILFGLFHLNHQQMFYAAAFGIILGFVDIKAQSILPSIFAHFCVNSFSFISSTVNSFISAEDGSGISGSPAALLINGLLNVFIITVIIAGIVLGIFEIIVNRSEFRLLKDDCNIGFRHLTAYLANPITVIFLIFSALLIILNSFVPF